MDKLVLESKRSNILVIKTEEEWGSRIVYPAVVTGPGIEETLNDLGIEYEVEEELKHYPTPHTLKYYNIKPSQRYDTIEIYLTGDRYTIVLYDVNGE